MKCNVGGLDRILRIVIGLIILALGVKLGKVITYNYWYLLGLIPLLTGLLGFCGLYTLIGVNTAKKAAPKKKKKK